MIVELTDGIIDAPALLAGMLGDGAGAVVSFCGVARPLGATGEPVKTLWLEHHPTLTKKSLDAIMAEAVARFRLIDAKVTHRWGSIQAGETIVFVAAAALHRRAAFEAADYLMDRLKTEAVFWKKETGPGGSCWIEPSETDLAAAARWISAG